MKLSWNKKREIFYPPEQRLVLFVQWKQPGKCWRRHGKTRCVALADSLYHSIGAQLTVDKHGAAPGRGNFIDNIDLPLNDVMWLMDRFVSIAALEHESERIMEIERLLNRTNPGPGGYYD